MWPGSVLSPITNDVTWAAFSVGRMANLMDNRILDHLIAAHRELQCARMELIGNTNSEAKAWLRGIDRGMRQLIEEVLIAEAIELSTAVDKGARASGILARLHSFPRSGPTRIRLECWASRFH